MNWLYALAQPFVWHPARVLLVALGWLLVALTLPSTVRRPLFITAVAKGHRWVVPWRARDVRPLVLRRRASRPQLTRDPLGTNAPGAPSHCYMRLVLFSLIVVALIAGLWWWGKRPRIYRNVPLNGLRRFIWSLLAQMASGGFLVADRRGGAGFLQLALRSEIGRAH